MSNKEQFLILPYKLLMAGGYVSNEGEYVKMNLTEKVIYTYIRNRFEFFKANGKEYYDTQKDIADVCNMDIKSVGIVLRKFIANGLTCVYKKPYGNFLKNVYTSIPDLNLWYKSETSASVRKINIDRLDVDDFEVNLSNIGYRPETELDINDLDIWV